MMNKCRRWAGVWLVLLPCVAAASPSTRLPGLPAPVAQTPAASPAAQWSTLTPAQQRQARANYAAYKALDEASRQRIRAAAAAWAHLDRAEQQTLFARFHSQDHMVRSGWRLGPALGAVYTKLQPLLGYVPAHQREPLLALIRSLDDGQREQLVLISQRTPPQERAGLREQLLALPAGARAQWLRENVTR